MANPIAAPAKLPDVTVGIGNLFNYFISGKSLREAHPIIHYDVVCL